MNSVHGFVSGDIICFVWSGTESLWKAETVRIETADSGAYGGRWKCYRTLLGRLILVRSDPTKNVACNLMKYVVPDLTKYVGCDLMNYVVSDLMKYVVFDLMKYVAADLMKYVLPDLMQ